MLSRLDFSSVYGIYIQQQTQSAPSLAARSFMSIRSLYNKAIQYSVVTYNTNYSPTKPTNLDLTLPWWDIVVYFFVPIHEWIVSIASPHLWLSTNNLYSVRSTAKSISHRLPIYACSYVPLVSATPRDEDDAGDEDDPSDDEEEVPETVFPDHGGLDNGDDDGGQGMAVDAVEG